MEAQTIISLVWLTVSLLAFVVEALTESMVSLWFALSALFVFALSFIPGFPLWLGIVLFFVLSLLLFLLIRRFFQKNASRKDDIRNPEDLVGKCGIVTKTITPEENGEVKVYGVLYTAMAKETVFEKCRVKVTSRKGNLLFVEKDNPRKGD